jgi:ABC-type antimicrobial peptide transport system permease subunit
MARNLMKLVIGFALIALAISMVGLAGVMAYVVSRRTREIGVRIALGADAKAIARAVLADGGRLVLGGLAIGLALGMVTARILQSLLFGVRAGDPTVIAAASLLVLGVGLATCLLPALRAASVSPLIAIRQD